MHAKFSYAHAVWVVIHWPYSPLYWDITEFIKSCATKTKCTFCQKAYGASMHGIEIPAHYTACTHGAPGSPIEQKQQHFFPSTLLNQNWCFDYNNNNKLHSMTTQNVRKKIPHSLHLKWTIFDWIFHELYQKVSDGNLLFWLSVYSA